MTLKAEERIENGEEPEESSGQESTAAEEEPEKPVGIFAGYEEQAGDMLRQMSLTEKERF